MNGSLKIFGAFAMGLVIGAAATQRYAMKKYSQIAQEEIDSVKETFSRLQKSEKAEKKPESESKPEVKEEDVNKAKEILRDNGYVRDVEEKTDGKERRMRRRKPYVISPEEFSEENDYDVISLNYYADGVLTDDNDEEIEDVEETVGTESLTHFGEYEDDSVYVKNDVRKCVFEILLDHRRYSDVIKHKPHPMEV